jgi:hypothetical protein
VGKNVFWMNADKLFNEAEKSEFLLRRLIEQNLKQNKTVTVIGKQKRIYRITLLHLRRSLVYKACLYVLILENIYEIEVRE